MRRMLALRCFPAIFTGRLESSKFWKKSNRNTVLTVVCAAKGPRPRYPRVWKSRRKIGTISKSLKLVECIKGLSNVKEEVYGALDSFIAWELEFPLITVKKAIKTLEHEKEWKRIIQVTKWMLSKGQGRTMGSYYTLLNALAEDGRLDEAEELWRKLLLENLESIPRIFFEKMISLYYRREMHEKMFEIFADMEELGVRPTVRIVTMVGDVFQKLDMLDKYRKLKKKYPPPRWEYRYVKGKRIKIRIDASKRHNYEIDASKRHNYGDVVANESDTETYSESDENIEASADRLDTETYSESDENIEACADRLNENTEACPDKLDEVDLII
ncbi:pentatricopeptide repeat-containing protein At4g21190 isoform X2 [Ipomoea triloba]|uniref:pentatricopeptide repeat-containing protein At4g21190 isoform X2 n=1 Tax=Ipomoea triloba TaxID=35885 RepID=UPI00125D03B7|nr:pentatricopeptide repeat-containing protein At4g21190 isoform X2 [Ipomoea triloba]XP_031109726.1 pentatricopeptide repeat-containing protein At4g21190 isoform X2 [Ipomoea triloba]